MMLPQKKSNELKPMKIKTSVNTPTSNPILAFIKKAGTKTSTLGRKFLDIATASPQPPGHHPPGR